MKLRAVQRFLFVPTQTLREEGEVFDGDQSLIDDHLAVLAAEDEVVPVPVADADTTEKKDATGGKKR
jgi:hypothetical protein